MLPKFGKVRLPNIEATHADEKLLAETDGTRAINMLMFVEKGNEILIRFNVSTST